MKSYDNILVHIGEFGPYHKKIVLLVSLMSVFAAFPAMIVVFSFMDVPFRCAIPGLKNDTFQVQNEAHQRLVNESIPYDINAGSYSQCSRYLRPPSDAGITNETTACEAWVYDPAYAFTSMVPELDLVCDRQHYKAHLILSVMLGSILAAFLAGQLSDTFGRKKPTIIFMMVQSVVLVTLASNPYLPAVLPLLALSATCGFGSFLVAYTLLIEITGASKRPWAGMGPMVGWSIGLCLTVPYFHFISGWRMAVYIMAAVECGVLAYWWLLPESPRWLLARKKMDAAQTLLHKIAKGNGARLPDDIELISIAESTVEADTNRKRFPIKEMKLLLTSRVLVFRVFILSFSWFTLNLAYTGTTFNIGSLVEGDIYLNFLTQAFMECLGYLMGFFVLNYLGRRLPLGAFLGISGATYFAYAVFTLLGIDVSWISLVCFGTGKFCISGAFMVIYALANELMPTVVRNSAVGICTFNGQFGGIVSPYLVLDDVIPGGLGKALPLFVFGSCSITSAILTLFLPETRNRKLPDTVKDAENMKRENISARLIARGHDEKVQEADGI